MPPSPLFGLGNPQVLAGLWMVELRPRPIVVVLSVPVLFGQLPPHLFIPCQVMVLWLAFVLLPSVFCCWCPHSVGSRLCGVPWLCPGYSPLLPRQCSKLLAGCGPKPNRRRFLCVFVRLGLSPPPVSTRCRLLCRFWGGLARPFPTLT